MADYKDIIAGTIENIVEKVKETAESGSVREIYEHGVSRAKSYGRVAKLTLELNGDSEELKRVYTEIGKLCYEQTKDAPEGFYAALFAQVAEISSRINAKADEIAAMKADYESASAPDVEVDIQNFDEVVDFNEDPNKK